MAAAAELPVNGDFENVVPITFPLSIEDAPIPDLGVWYGDPAAIVTAENGVTPAKGNHMLRFDDDTSNLHQFISTPPELRGTDVRFHALFNAQENSRNVSIGLVSLSDALVAGSPFPDDDDFHGVGEDIRLDTDPLTWELFEVELSIPNDSQTLLFLLDASNENGAVYADGARLVPEPATLSDLTGNGFVDFDDLAILLSNWDKDASAALGNLVFPDSTSIDFTDLAFLLSEWTGPDPAGSPEAALGTEAVPEPSSLVLVLLATLGLSFYRRRRRRAF